VKQRVRQVYVEEMEGANKVTSRLLETLMQAEGILDHNQARTMDHDSGGLTVVPLRDWRGLADVPWSPRLSHEERHGRIR
jgi:hypothetical protein